MIGKTISHYHILEKLGEGGMGIVYKAEDTKLKRTVALKFLPPEMTRDPEAKARFIHEAQAASALQHHNICTIHDVDETEDGQIFIVMDYYQGETLKEKLASQQLAVGNVVDIATQIAAGLQEAHTNGIVHRDIKPANIMITNKGEVKIMDFGVAKLSGKTKLTKESSTLGTVAYMSPEQARGETVDQRADIWSLGAVMYEMICGQTPFKGDYQPAIVYSIMNEKPTPLTGLRSDVPLELERMVNKCLEKDPTERYQHLDELKVDLHHLQKETEVKKVTHQVTIAPVHPKKHMRFWMWPGIFLILLALLVATYFLWVQEVESKERIPIAVVDFVNETTEPELDGLSGMLITALEQSQRLRVLTRSRMFDILKQLGREDVEQIDEAMGREICRQADIGMLAIATVRKFGKVYTIDFKVLDVPKNEYLFTTIEKGEGQESIPGLIDNLSEKTRQGLKEKLAEIEASKQKIAEVTTPNLEAYQFYFKGEELINKLKFKEAQVEFKKAIALDSTFGLAYYRLAYAIDWERDTQTARKYIQKAMNLLDRIPDKEKYLIRAEYANIEQGFSSGLVILREMEQFYPDDKEMVYNIGDWSWHVGDYATAEKYLGRVLSTDPDFERALQHITWTYRNTKQYEKMLKTAERYVAVSGSGEAYELLTSALIHLKDYDRAFQRLREAEKLQPDNHLLRVAIANVYLQQENYQQAEAELMNLINKDQPVAARISGYSNLSRAYAYEGRYRQACKMLDELINCYWQIKDTSSAAYVHIIKAFNLIVTNNLDSSWKEMEKTIPLQKSVEEDYWYALSDFYIYHRDYDKAESLAKSLSNKWWYLFILALTHADKNECIEAESLADTLMPRIPEPLPILLYYHLANCEFENGQLDKAEKNLLLSQDITDNTSGFRSWYYPRSFYLLGKIYQQRDQLDVARKYYQKFLDLWKNADENLPELIDAKRRLAQLNQIM
jgi:tetratricopeptide (TPR) repeat protein